MPRVSTLERGYQGDLSYGRTLVGGDAMLFLDGSVDGQGGSLRGKTIFTAQHAADYLNRGDGLVKGLESGAIWRGAYDHLLNGRASAEDFYGTAKSYDYVSGALTHLNFGFYNTTADIDAGYAFIGSSTVPGALRLDGFSKFNDAQRDGARQAIAAWDELVAISFVETDAAHADINYMNTTTGPIQASAYLPWDYGAGPEKDSNGNLIDWNRVAGDVAVNPSQPSNLLFDEGQYGLTTLIHETGHSLGLEHPGSYNFGVGFDVIYENGAEYFQDSYQYTLMSYWGGEETGMQEIDWNNLTYRYNSTPGVHDILAIQQMYGADMTTRAGSDHYGFNAALSTPGLNNDSYDFVKTPAPVISIWDAGGEDTLDLSGYNTPSILDLNPGAFSSAGGTVEFLTLAQINANRALEELAPRTQATLDVYNDIRDQYLFTNGLMHDNISIAYGAVIENAVGGGGDDIIIANNANNHLDGRGGNDVVSFQTATAAVQVDLGLQTVTGGGSSDVIVNFEGATGTKFADTILGTDGDNVIDGGDGDDLLTAGAGNDTLSYASASGGVRASLTNGAQNTGLGTDTISGFENLTGSNFNDRLIGDANANVIKSGNGLDVVSLGAGNDTFVAEIGFLFDKVKLKSGLMSVDIVTDFNTNGDLIDLSNLGRDFAFIGTATSDNKAPYTVSTKMYDSLKGAENALGLDIHSKADANVSGPVTVVYADLNGGKPDMAIILLNTSGVDHNDFIWG